MPNAIKAIYWTIVVGIIALLFLMKQGSIQFYDDKFIRLSGFLLMLFVVAKIMTAVHNKRNRKD